MSDTDLTPGELHDLEIYKSIVEGRPLNHALTLDDLEHVKTLAEELKQAEEADKPKLEKIDKLEAIIQERQIQLETLRSQLNQKLQYLRSNPTPIKPTTVNHISTKEEYAGITESAIMEVLKANPYGLGNVEIAKKLGLEGTKGQQNKIWNLCKKMTSVKSENRMWKLV